MRKVGVVALVDCNFTVSVKISVAVAENGVVSSSHGFGIVVLLFETFVVHRSRNTSMFADEFDRIAARFSLYSRFLSLG
jgi:hypothetical protein